MLQSLKQNPVTRFCPDIIPRHDCLDMFGKYTLFLYTIYTNPDNFYMLFQYLISQKVVSHLNIQYLFAIVPTLYVVHCGFPAAALG